MSLRRLESTFRVVVLASLVPACTTANPLYVPSDAAVSQFVDDLGSSSNDLSTSPKADLSQGPPTCSAGQRACGSGVSLSCEGGMFVIDRACPNNSSCMSGHCQPPPTSTNGTGQSCAFSGTPSETLCLTSGGNNPTCTPFVSANSDVKWVCARPIGAGTPGTACNKGSDCRTGFCGSNGTCFRACAGDADCPSVQGPGHLVCDVVDIVVEGTTISAQSCVPQ